MGLFSAIKNKKDWDDLEKLKRENDEMDRRIQEKKDRIAENLRKDPHYYDGNRDDEH